MAVQTASIIALANMSLRIVGIVAKHLEGREVTDQEILEVEQETNILIADFKRAAGIEDPAPPPPTEEENPGGTNGDL